MGHVSLGVFHMPVIAENAHMANRHELCCDVVCHQVEELAASLIL